MSSLQQINADARKIIKEEEDLLTKVINRLSTPAEREYSKVDYNSALVAVRDAINEAREEDQPQLYEQMARLQAIVSQRGKGENIPINPRNPYFGHLRLKEHGKSRDVLIGKHTFLDTESSIRIVDWRNAPVSKIYYCYDEGDDYEEEMNDQIKEGVVEKRRALSIDDGVLKRISCPSGIFLKRGGDWQGLSEESYSLSGGQGSAVRPKALSKLGVGADGQPRVDFHLPEISALIDKNQFGLITNEQPGILVVRGSAGSGKTTVALHRVAYLLFADRKRYTPDKVLIIVANQALASYTSQVLPALGIRNIKVTTYKEWTATCRKQIVKEFVDNYNDDTPAVVSRLKRHPMIIKAIVSLASRRTNDLTKELTTALSGQPDGQTILDAWKKLAHMTYEQRRQVIIKVLTGERQQAEIPNLSRLSGRAVQTALNILDRQPYSQRRLLQDWANIITDGDLLQQLINENAAGEFSAEDLETILRWNREMYSRITDYAPGEDDDDEDDLPALDHEDDTIMLALYQHNVGRLPGPGGKLEYAHLMVDEVQDFSPFEVRIMLRTTQKGATITLAGDDAQAIIEESSFKGWDNFLGQLGNHEVMMEQLQTAYRSTAEIMEVAQAVLGPLAPKQPKSTRHGAPVELHRFGDTGQAVDFLASALRQLMMREPMASVAVIARHAQQAKLYYDSLKKAEVPHLRLVAREDFVFSPGIDVTEIKQVKGLEFDYVILVEVNQDSYPDDLMARHFLHVGLTRAAHQLWCISSSKPSPLLPKWLLE